MAALPVLSILPVAALSALVVLSLLAPRAAESVAVPLALTGALLGVPHGAVDHLVPWWLGRSRRGGSGERAVAAFVVGYVAVAGLALAASLVWPAPTFVAFLALSVVHFGRGEVVTSAERAGREVPGPRQEWATTLAPGLVVVGLLLWGRPDRTSQLLRPVSAWLARAVPASASVGLVVVAASVVLALAVQLRHRRLLDAAELVLLTVAFALAPPLAAFGVWFGLWHAVRHTGRLLDLARTDSPSDPTSKDWWVALRRLGVAGALPTAAALSAVVALWVLRDVAGLQAEVGVLLALTFPHAAVVWTLDQREVRRG